MQVVLCICVDVSGTPFLAEKAPSFFEELWVSGRVCRYPCGLPSPITHAH